MIETLSSESVQMIPFVKIGITLAIVCIHVQNRIFRFHLSYSLIKERKPLLLRKFSFIIPRNIDQIRRYMMVDNVKEMISSKCLLIFLDTSSFSHPAPSTMLGYSIPDWEHPARPFLLPGTRGHCPQEIRSESQEISLKIRA